MQVLELAASKHIRPIMCTQFITEIAIQDPANRNFLPLDRHWLVY